MVQKAIESSQERDGIKNRSLTDSGSQFQRHRAQSLQTANFCFLLSLGTMRQPTNVKGS